MKKVLVILMLITLLLVLSSCDIDGYDIDDDYGISEWISPDGVHYWTYNCAYWFGLAPRYDSAGQLVIEGR